MRAADGSAVAADTKYVNPGLIASGIRFQAERRVQQQQQKSAATAAAAAARQGLNEINTAMTLNRFLTCGIVVF